MRIPLFELLRYARAHPLVPKEHQHSGIESLMFLRSRGRPYALYFYQPRSGIDCINAIVNRVFRERWPVRASAVAAVREAVADSIYEHPSQFSRYVSAHVSCYQSGCGRKTSEDQLLFDQGRQCWSALKRIPIQPAPLTPCHWCGTLFFKPDSWSTSFRTQDGYTNKWHCNSRECRRISWLQHTPQSRGGIALTPRQRDDTLLAAWDTQKTINYLIATVKEIKQHGSNTNRNLRGRSQVDPEHHS